MTGHTAMQHLSSARNKTATFLTIVIEKSATISNTDEFTNISAASCTCVTSENVYGVLHSYM